MCSLFRGVRKASSMASKSAKVVLAAVACCGPLLLAGLRGVAGAQDTSTSTAGGGGAARLQPRTQPQPATTAPVNPTRLLGWPFERLGRPVNGTPAPTDDEWRQVEALFSDISPVRWRVYEQVLARP